MQVAFVYILLIMLLCQYIFSTVICLDTVICSGKSGKYKVAELMVPNAKGVRNEAPKGWGVERGVPLPWGGVWGEKMGFFLYKMQFGAYLWVF